MFCNKEFFIKSFSFSSLMLLTLLLLLFESFVSSLLYKMISHENKGKKLTILSKIKFIFGHFPVCNLL